MITMLCMIWLINFFPKQKVLVNVQSKEKT